MQADVFPFMRDMIRSQRKFDRVVLDPPKLINSRAEIAMGTRTHFDLNRLAMQLIRPGGMLLTCSCAGLLSDTDFVRLVFAAARQANLNDPPDPGGTGGRSFRLLAHSGAGPDHPVAAHCAESAYLKALWIQLSDQA